jgi:hypothetical protein
LNYPHQTSESRLHQNGNCSKYKDKRLLTCNEIKLKLKIQMTGEEI